MGSECGRRLWRSAWIWRVLPAVRAGCDLELDAGKNLLLCNTLSETFWLSVACVYILVYERV